MQASKRLSFSERLGRWGVMRVVWCAIPWVFRPFVFPYCLFVYSRFLSDSTDVDEVKSMHLAYCYESMVFRLFRPRFHLVRRALLSLETEVTAPPDREAVTMVLPIPEGLSEQKATVPLEGPVELSRPASEPREM